MRPSLLRRREPARALRCTCSSGHCNHSRGSCTTTWCMAALGCCRASGDIHMKRVTGIGGIFFAASDPVALRAWYQKHLGVDVQSWGGTAFTWTDESGKPRGGTTVWSIGTGENFAPGKARFMINYRVADLAKLLESL